MGEYLHERLAAGGAADLIAAFLVLLTTTGLVLAGGWLSAVDLREHRLPRRVVRPVWGAASALLAAAGLLGGEPLRLVGMLAGGLGMLGLYLLLRRASRGALGLGDVRLAGMLGTVLGFLSPVHVLWGCLLGFVAGGLAAAAALGLTALGRRWLGTPRVGLHDSLAFGPSMLLGAGLAVVAL